MLACPGCRRLWRGRRCSSPWRGSGGRRAWGRRGTRRRRSAWRGRRPRRSSTRRLARFQLRFGTELQRRRFRGKRLERKFRFGRAGSGCDGASLGRRCRRLRRRRCGNPVFGSLFQGLHQEAHWAALLFVDGGVSAASGSSESSALAAPAGATEPASAAVAAGSGAGGVVTRSLAAFSKAFIKRLIGRRCSSRTADFQLGAGSAGRISVHRCPARDS